MRKLFLIIVSMYFLVSFDRPLIKKNVIATWYGEPFHGRKTATGEIYNMNEMTCATTWNAKTRRLGYKFGTKLKVTNLSNGKSVIVRVNDTGSFAEKYGRELDLSKAAFSKIANIDNGVIKANIEIVK